MLKTIEQKVLKFIDENNLIIKGDKVLVAFSGGADSIFLLNFLIKYRRRLGIDLAAFHLNHKLREMDADADENFCKDFCLQNNIEFKSISKDVKFLATQSKKSIEETAREVRYAELLKAAEEFKADKIATAHNSSDNTETVFLNLVKGSGLNGLTGIPIRRENIIRPILCLTSDEIRSYLRSNKILFRFDKSNLNIDYERNFLRNEIIPKLKQKLNPQLEEKITNTSKVIKNFNEFLEKEINSLAKTASTFDGKKLRIDLRKIKLKDTIFATIFFKNLLEKYFEIELSSENIKSLVELMSYQTGKEIHLKKNVTAFRNREDIIIGKERNEKKEVILKRVKIGQKVILEGKEILIEPVSKKNIKFNRSKFVEYISGDLIKGTFEIRKWKAGDRFKPIGMKGTKKLSDFLTDEKVSSNKKDESFVLTNSGKIVWVIGLRIDDRFKITPDTKKILRLTIGGN
jgi:tRNA(Ile)-lysidine synthase